MQQNREINRHHLFWEGRQYRKNNILTRLRNHHGFIIPMNIYDHRELHADLRPTPKPTQQEAEELLQHIGSYDSQSERIDYLDMAIGFFSEKRPLLAQHLTEQRGYVLLHPMTTVERDLVAMEQAEMGLYLPPQLAPSIGRVAVA